MAVDIRLNDMINALDIRLRKIDLNDCELSVRTLNALRKIGAQTLWDAQRAILNRTMIKQYGIGPKAVREVQEIIDSVSIDTPPEGARAMTDLTIDTLSPRRAKDRIAIARILQETAEAAGATVTVSPNWPDVGCSETYVRVSMAGVSVGITIGSCEAKNGYVMPWFVEAAHNAKLSDDFGTAAGGEVNRSHRRKCTVVCGNLRTARRRLDLALQCIASGAAFVPAEGTALPANSDSIAQEIWTLAQNRERDDITRLLLSELRAADPHDPSAAVLRSVLDRIIAGDHRQLNPRDAV